MAHTALHIGDSSALLHKFAAPFNAIGKAMIRLAESNSRMQEVNYLNGLTDAELNKRGIKRSEIAHHVFKDVYYV
ncbi:hypothetical protein [Shimia sp. FJ5]|uniref:hypothetical protein n=1 Tax=Shimia sp. FJ5 TaxID=3079054 RepID=UPI00261A4AD0|nr:hypothetical protein [Shimia sp. FJ5]MDV4143499.1 hypothetical protein [Shimia sp. FJ5]